MNEENDLTLQERLGVKLALKLEDLQKLVLGSKEHGQAAKDITELLKAYYQSVDGDAKYDVDCKRIEAEMARFEAEKEIKEKQLELEEKKLQLEEKQLELEEKKSLLDEKKFELEIERLAKDDKRSTIGIIIDTGLKVAGIAVQIFIPKMAWKKYQTMFEQGLEFEKEGTFTSAMLRGVKNIVKPDSK